MLAVILACNFQIYFDDWYLQLLISSQNWSIQHLCCRTCAIRNPLTPRPLVPHICVSQSGQHWFRWWLVAWTAPSHYLNQCWNIVNCTLRNKLQWNLNLNSNIFIQEIAFESVVWEMAAILSRPQCVKNVLNTRDQEIQPLPQHVWRPTPVAHPARLDCWFV